MTNFTQLGIMDVFDNVGIGVWLESMPCWANRVGISRMKVH